MNLDILVFASHPDDAELSMGGTIAKYSNAGFKIGVIDLSGGELGTRGTVETRKLEAQKATKILNLAYRGNLGFEDGNLKLSKEYLNSIIIQIRKFQPKILFAPYFNDRHPDHIGTSQLVKEAMFFTGLAKVITEDDDKQQNPFRPDKLYYYMQTYEFQPSFIVDITDSYNTKMEAVKAYSTQFHNPDSNEPETFISQPKFLYFLEARARYFGFKIGKDFGEAFFCEEEIEYDFTSYLKK